LRLVVMSPEEHCGFASVKSVNRSIAINFIQRFHREYVDGLLSFGYGRFCGLRHLDAVRSDR
jgi:hypothetical protein